MDLLRVEIKGDKELVAKLEQSSAQLPAAMTRMGLKSAMAMKRELMIAYSGGVLQPRKGSAGLAGSVEEFCDSVGGELHAGAGTKKIYARIHEVGGQIRPRTKLLLKFKIGSQWISTKGPVTIPARHPAEHAAGQAEPVVRQIWLHGLGELPVLRG